MQKKYKLENIDGDDNIEDIYEQIQSKISEFLNQTKQNENTI